MAIKTTIKMVIPPLIMSLSQGPMPKPLSHPSNPRPSSVCNHWVSWFKICNCLCIDTEWSDKFIQHMPSNSSQPWPWANKRKSMAALFWRVACLTESTSTNKSLIARDVALVCLASQQPSLLSCARAPADATPGVKNEVAIISPGDQNFTLSWHLLLKLCTLRRIRLLE